MTSTVPKKFRIDEELLVEFDSLGEAQEAGEICKKLEAGTQDTPFPELIEQWLRAYAISRNRQDDLIVTPPYRSSLVHKVMVSKLWLSVTRYMKGVT